MMWALIDSEGVVVQVAEREFPVAPPMQWREASEGVRGYGHRWDGARFVELPVEPGPPAEVPRPPAPPKLPDVPSLPALATTVNEIVDALVARGILRRD